MARKPTAHPTDAELAILRALWEQGPSGLGDLWRVLNARRPMAKTTVATMLNVMLEKRLVRRQRTRHGYRWSPEITREDTARGMVGKVIDQLFEGSAKRLVLHLADQGRLSPADVQAIQRLLAPGSGTSGGPGTGRRKGNKGPDTPTES